MWIGLHDSGARADREGPRPCAPGVAPSAMRRPLLLTALIALSVLVPSAPAAAQTTDRDCSDFANQAAAQDFFVGAGGPDSDPHQLDGDRDGVACESVPCPCRTASTEPPPPTAVPPARRTIRGRITSVADGDTVNVRARSGKRHRVRLVGIDTPETGKPGTPAECGAVRATVAMKALAFKRVGGRRIGRAVTMTTDPTQDERDQFGRLLAYVRTDARKVLQREQLRSGWAKVFVFARPFERVDDFRSAEAGARGAARGVWGLCGGDFDRPA